MKIITVISHWAKPGSAWVKVGTNPDRYERHHTGDRLALCIVEIDGKRVTRHIKTSLLGAA